MELSKENLIATLERVLDNPCFERVAILHTYEPPRVTNDKLFLEPYFRLNVVLKGIIALDCGSGRERGMREFSAGTVLMMKPLCLTKEPTVFTHESENLGIVCRPDYLRLLYSICPKGLEQAKEIDYYYHIHDTLRQGTLHAINAFCSLEDEAEASQLAMPFMTAICSMVLHDLKASSQGEVGRSYDLWCRILEFIAERPPETCTRRAISKHFNVTETYVSMLFPRYSGMTFSEYIRKKAIDMAAMLLKTTDLSVKEVADRCGFSSHSHFTSVFRTIYHVTPGAWRKTM